MLGKLTDVLNLKRTKKPSEEFLAYTPIQFKKVESKALALAKVIETKEEEIIDILLEYESFEVATDEIYRTLDLLKNLHENEEYFKLRIGEVAAFLPRNQPLYAFSCFVIVPSFMASAVNFRIPHSMRHFFPKLLAALEIYTEFPNIQVSHSPRQEFLLERSMLRVNPATKETWPVTQAVIFTGTPAHADQLRLVFDQRTLFITNGSGHNPVVVSKDADLEAAAEAVLTLQLYNQGQDCAAPNAILVHSSVYSQFLKKIRKGIKEVKVGEYRDRGCRVGPISDPKDLVRVQEFLIDNRKWLDESTPGIIRSADAILEPTIVAKPLAEGGNFDEIFAPVLFLQEYEEDLHLGLYFEDPHYATNAMYITIYGSSPYIEKHIVGRSIAGKVLHDSNTVLRNIHLHSHGIERGTEPYGGNGYGASNLSINNEIVCKPTLPQRDIFENVTKQFLDKAAGKVKIKQIQEMTDLQTKDVQKLLRLKQDTQNEKTSVAGIAYLDTALLDAGERRYVAVDEDQLQRLLETPNAEYIAHLELKDREMIKSLRELLLEMKEAVPTDFETRVYALAVDSSTSNSQKKERQLHFFKIVYNLLFAKNSGPRLAQFLVEADREKLCELLDV